MKTEYLINYKPINFIFQFIILALKITLVFFAGFFLFYLFSTDSKRLLISSRFDVFGYVYLGVLVLALFQTWVNSSIYIYQVKVCNEVLLVKWQDRNKFKEISLDINNVNAQIMPSGKNTPYLNLKLNDGNNSIELKQTYYPRWNKRTMEKFVLELKIIKESS